MKNSICFLSRGTLNSERVGNDNTNQEANAENKKIQFAYTSLKVLYFYILKQQYYYGRSFLKPFFLFTARTNLSATHRQIRDGNKSIDLIDCWNCCNKRYHCKVYNNLLKPDSCSYLVKGSPILVVHNSSNQFFKPRPFFVWPSDEEVALL